MAVVRAAVAGRQKVMSVSQSKRMTKVRLPLVVDGVRVDIAGMHREGSGIPLVFLHGFGSTKEDYADVIQAAGLADRPVLAYDAPGAP
jgi:pimeloyl-ACP methyl ester carboxylesterase